MNCCEIPGKIPSFPQTWRNELEALLCEIINARQVIDCQTVKDCETLTSFNSFQISDSNLILSYTDERGTTTSRSVNLNDLNIDLYNFFNGITEFNGDVYLGGPLTQNTTILLGAYNFNINGEGVYFNEYPSTRFDENPDNFLFTNASGKLMSGQLSDLTEDYFSAPLEFNNGLTRTDDLVQLGGNLIQPTVIGATNSDQELVDNHLHIRNHTGIGDLIPGDAARLVTVHYATSGNENTNGIYTDKVFLSVDPSADSFGILAMHSVRGATDIDFTSVNNAGLSARFSYNSNTANVIGNVNGVISELLLTASESLAGGNIESFTAYRAGRPRQGSLSFEGNELYGGSIEKIYGLYVEDLRDGVDIDPSVTIDETWGIYQDGVGDRNHFNGNSSFGAENRNPECSVLTTKYGNFIDRQYPLLAVKAFLTSATASGLGDYFATTTSKLDVYEPQLAAVGFQDPITDKVVYNPIASFEGQITYASQNADITAALIGYKSSISLASGTVDPDETRPSINGGDIETVIGFLATRPLQILDNSFAIAGTYNGTINNTFGVFIESQRSPDETGNSLTGFTQNNTWGIYQAGTTDVNYFGGNMRLNVASVPTYADDTAAGVGGLVSGDLYKKATGELMIKL